MGDRGVGLSYQFLFWSLPLLTLFPRGPHFLHAWLDRHTGREERTKFSERERERERGNQADRDTGLLVLALCVSRERENKDRQTTVQKQHAVIGKESFFLLEIGDPASLLSHKSVARKEAL